MRCYIVRLTIRLATGIGMSGLSSSGQLVRLVIRSHHDKLPFFLAAFIGFWLQ